MPFGPYVYPVSAAQSTARASLEDLASALEAELAQYAEYVVLYASAEAYVQHFGDLGVGATPEDEGEALLVFGREPGLVGGLLQASRGLFLVARGQESDAPASAGALDGVEEFLA